MTPIRQIAPFGALSKTFSPDGVICKHFSPRGYFARKLHACPKQTISQTGKFAGSEEPTIPIGDFIMHGGTVSQTSEFLAGEGKGPGYVAGLRRRGVQVNVAGTQESPLALAGCRKNSPVWLASWSSKKFQRIKRNARLSYACIPFFCLYPLHCIRFFSWFLLPLHSFFSCYYVF